MKELVLSLSKPPQSDSGDTDPSVTSRSQAEP
uniref:Uncharacterized protein n=1 Tax=Arundo donax TaxID=35708 RepID=A0A0A9E366_ARUDO